VGQLSKRFSLAGLAAAILALLLLPVPPVAYEGIWSALGNAVHFPLMATFTLVVCSIWTVGQPARPLPYKTVAVVACATVTLTEAIQPMVGRNASLIDLVHGLLGVAAGLVGVYAWRNGGRRFRLIHGLVTLALLVPILHPMWLEWRADVHRSELFPVLGTFEDEIELRLWRDRSPIFKWPTTLKLSSEHVSEGRRSLAVRTGDGAWPGVIYTAGGLDWEPYDALQWEIYNPADPFRLAIRIDDTMEPDRGGSFNRSMTVEPGWNHFEVPTDDIRRGPETRTLDLGRIRRLYIYAEGDRRRLFFLDGVRLAETRDTP
jgi:hypothetical protein